MAQNIERRIEKLEASLRMGDKPKTLEDLFQALERGEYGPINLASVIAAILTNGGSGEHLRGKGLPDELIDCFVERIKKENTEETVNEN